jgi:leucyl aminopeptidase
VKGTNADLANISSPAVGAGSITAAAFLRHFVPASTEWCHLDIAGTAWNTAARDWVGGSGGSGVGTRLLIEYLDTRS